VAEQKRTHSNRAILVSIFREGDGFRVSLDDAVRDANEEALWRRVEHVTNKPMSANNIERMEFAESEFADFGHYILARLSAFVQRGEN